MVLKGLSDFMDRHGIIAAAAIDVVEGQKVVVGNRNALESDYSLRTLFDDLSAQEIEAHLEGQVLPKMSQQGKVCGIICKPIEDLIVGLYYHDERDIIERYKFSETVCRELQDLFTQSR